MTRCACRWPYALLLTLGWCLVQTSAGQAADRVETRLAAEGKAAHPVVVPTNVSERGRQAAQTLARYLERISGARFEVSPGDGKSGIAVGRPSQFPGLPFLGQLDEKESKRSEDYLLRSHPQGLFVLGASDLAVEHAVWDLLYRIGHRQFFPGETWEVVPRIKDLRVQVDAKEQPSYHSRRIWYGFGAWDYAAQPYADWCARNRANGGITLRTGHAYDGIINRNKAEFAKHPEYLGLVNGERKTTKICIGNPDLRQLVIADALAQFRNDPQAQSISVDPSDGGGWCECPKCKALGSVSDRALTLANEVAAAVNAKFGDKYVGIYAYSQHSPPPSIKVHPRVIISVATAFITGGYKVDQLIDGWQRQGATLGIREYYSVSTWDRDLPGSPRGSNLTYLKTTIPHFHAKGARFLSAESSDNWGPNGLGYYVAGRIMWDVREADRVDALVADFLDKAFGPAREPMAGFYRLLDGSRKPLLSDDLVGRMYRFLADARKRTEDTAIQARIDDLILYTRYVELWMAYSTAEGPARQKAFEEMIRHVYRMRRTMLVHAKALYRDVPSRDKSLVVPKECAWNVPEGKNPWKSKEPFARAELDSILAAGIANRKLLDFTPVSFGDVLVPATKLELPDVPSGTMGLYSRGVRPYHTWVAQAPTTLTFKVKAGLIYGNRGDAKLGLLPAAEPEGKAVANATVAPDKVEREVQLRTTFQGHHRVEVSDSSAGTSLTWPDGFPITVASFPGQPGGFHGRWTLYFYVPRGTKTVGGYSSGAGGFLLDAEGKKVHTFEKVPGYFSVPVPPGQDGRLWKFQQCVGQRLLMTVPPYLARNGKEMLLPTEVVERDARK